MPTLESLQKQINELQDRNKLVEKDKKRETSAMRKALILGFTYISLVFYMRAIHIPQPWLNAVIPSVGFRLSTLSLPRWKQQRMKYTNNSKK